MATQHAVQHRRTRKPGLVDAGVLSPLSYNLQVLGDGPWGFWPMNETSGTSVADISGNNRNASIVGAPSLNQSGWPGEGAAIAFNGNLANYIDISSTSGLTATDEITWEALVYYISGDGVVASRGTANADTVHAIEIANATTITFFSWTTSFSVTVPSLANGWHHIAITRDSANRRIFLDGALAGSPNASGTPAWGNAPTYIGRTIAAGLPFNGRIQKVAYYTKALNLTQIQAHYAALGPPV